MVTVGYGDIVPANNNEKLFAMVAELASCVIFGYTMNTM